MWTRNWNTTTASQCIGCCNLSWTFHYTGKLWRYNLRTFIIIYNFGHNFWELLLTLKRINALQPLLLYGHIQQTTNWLYLSYFSQDTGFDILYKLSPWQTIWMKCQILFSGKHKKNISICCLLKILPKVLSFKESTLSWELLPFSKGDHASRKEYDSLI